MSQLHEKRHSLAHLLAASVKELYPGSHNAIGPSIDEGFYQDFEMSVKITDEDLPKIQAKMLELSKTWKNFEKKEATLEEALEIFKDNPYKCELAREFATEGKTLTVYTSGGFVDLCKGGHADSFSDIAPDSFKLDKIAGAYWRGDEKNKMLTRIYGLAFDTKEELDECILQKEEAKKRDHKKLGPELDLFTFSPLVGPGLPLWTPKGTMVRNILDEYVWELRNNYGYDKVEIPHITKKDLYEVSGHWEKYQDELFKIVSREGHEFAMKPMNCPHHTQIYNRKQWSYRELPQRYANTTACYRDEQSGELTGLSRVRAFSQDDAHVFCRLSQFEQETENIWNIVQTFYETFGLKLRVRISKHDPATPDKYLGGKDRWELAENALTEVAKRKGAGMEIFEGIGEAAFYGPKLDFIAKDSIGRDLQVATIQLDMNLPERFDLNCINEKGEKERIVMLHAAIMGSLERFISVAIEHFAGAFPVWMSPVQVAILPVSNEKHGEYATNVMSELKKAGVRVQLMQDETLGKRIREAKMTKIPYQIIIGDKEVESNTLTVEGRNDVKLEAISLNDFVEKVKQEIAERTLN